MSATKLQKLVYYSQVWAVVWTGEVLFPERIFAWKNGPVVRELYDVHRGQFRVERIPGGNSKRLSADEKDTIDRVLAFYGDKSAQWLSDLSHMEEPWRQAWHDAEPGEQGSKEISLACVAEYYTSLEPSKDAAE